MRKGTENFINNNNIVDRKLYIATLFLEHLSFQLNLDLVKCSQWTVTPGVVLRAD